MSASRYDFNIEQGSSFTLSITYKDSNGSVVDITDYCARLTWKTNNGTTQTFSTTDNNLSQYSFTIDGPNGLIKFMMPSDITNTLSFKTAKYDLELQSDTDLYTGGGKETIRILYGVISIIQRFSQSSNALDCT